MLMQGQGQVQMQPQRKEKQTLLPVHILLLLLDSMEQHNTTPHLISQPFLFQVNLGTRQERGACLFDGGPGMLLLLLPLLALPTTTITTTTGITATWPILAASTCTCNVGRGVDAQKASTPINTSIKLVNGGGADADWVHLKSPLAQSACYQERSEIVERDKDS
eukprot:1153532-Pelagomonas_calceolata.AAC.6